MSDPNENEELLHRLADGELEQGVSAPELDEVSQAELRSIEALSSMLKAELPKKVEPQYPDFFNSQIIRRIERDEARELHEASPASSGSAAEGSGSTAPAAAGPGGFFRWFPWAAAATACAVAAFLALQGGGSAAHSGGAVIASAYAPASTVQVKTWYSEEAEATVIDLVGLEAFPADREISGQTLASYPVEGLRGSRIAHQLSGPDGEILMTLVAAPGEAPDFFGALVN